MISIHIHKNSAAPVEYIDSHLQDASSNYYSQGDLQRELQAIGYPAPNTKNGSEMKVSNQ